MIDAGKIGLIAGGLALFAALVRSARMPWPVPGGVVTSRFRTASRPDHNGVDLRAPIGTPVTAPRGGVVVRSWDSYRGGRSLLVELDNGLVLGLAHLSERLVETGDVVQAGQTIAHTGNTGVTTGPHLHLTLRRAGELVDPEKYFA